MKKKQIQFEMIPCPVCGKPMPKKRLELGYGYCINCSTEKPKVCLVEGTQEGDGAQAKVVIMSSQEAQKILGYKNTGLGLDHLDDEIPLDVQTFEEQEEFEKTATYERLGQVEGDFGYEISERTGQDLETIGGLSDEDLEAEIILEEDDAR